MTMQHHDNIAIAEARVKALTEQVREYEVLCDLVQDEIELLTKHLAISTDISTLAAHDGKRRQYRDLRLHLEQSRGERDFALSDLARIKEILGINLQKRVDVFGQIPACSVLGGPRPIYDTFLSDARSRYEIHAVKQLLGVPRNRGCRADF